MRRQNFAFLFISIISVLVLSCTKSTKNSATKQLRQKEVVVYSYDSFIGEWGPGPQIKNQFESDTGYTLIFINCGDSVQAFNRAVLEKNNVQADVLIGVDNYLADKARSSDILTPYKPKNADRLIAPEISGSLGNDWLLTPYDYNHFSFVYDTKSTVPCPASLEDLTKSVYQKKIILMDPRTSTPGLGFVAWTVAVFGEKYIDYWKALKPNILTMAPGWSAGYGLFTNGEAPLVISYATDTAYHVENDKSNRFAALLFDEGHIRQVEGYGLLKGAPNEKGAKSFMDFMLSDKAQSYLPLTQWMYPANKNVTLPDCYKTSAPVPKKTISADPVQVNQAVEKVMQLLAE